MTLNSFSPPGTFIGRYTGKQPGSTLTIVGEDVSAGRVSLMDDFPNVGEATVVVGPAGLQGRSYVSWRPVEANSFASPPFTHEGPKWAMPVGEPSFNTVQELLDEDGTILGYEGSSSQVIVAEGDIIPAGGFRYQVAASVATDEHVTTAGGVKLYVLDDGTTIIDAFGAVYSGDESAIAQRMLDALNALRVPQGRVLTAKNIELPNAARVEVYGTLRLPDGCADNDRLLNANGKTGLDIRVNEIDGNAAGQSGVLGTHLVYLVGCMAPRVRVQHAHSHFINASAPMPDSRGDGRNTSTGAIWLHECLHADVIVDNLIGWAREGLMLNKCTGGQVGLGYALGTGFTEYSGLQANNYGITLLYAHVENAGASGVGFDTVNGRASNIYVKNNREQMGLNLGHPGQPATGSVINGVTIDGAWVGGIRIGSNSEDVSISDFRVIDAERGLQASDGVPDVRFANGVVSGGRWNVLAGGSDIFLTGVKSDEMDPRIVQVTGVTGQFVAGETITGPDGSGVVRRVLNNLTGVKQRLHLVSVTGTFAPASTVTGGSSGASGSVEYDDTPLQYLQQSNGMVAGDYRVEFPGIGTYVRNTDGSATFWSRMDITGVADTDVVRTLNFIASMTWAEPPTVQATLASAPSAVFELTKLLAFATTADLTVSLRTTTSQVYSVAVLARGRWKA